MIERPLILVPGILESGLAIKKDPCPFDIWPLKPSYLLDEVIYDLGTNIRESKDNVSVVPTGLLPGAYDGIIGAIIKFGYKQGSNFWAFPYDWRQSNDISGQQLTEFIENKNLAHGVDIICHSMGGFVTRAAIKQGKAPIKRTAYIASPHFGNPMSYFELNPKFRNAGFGDVYEKTMMTDELRRFIDSTIGFTGPFVTKMNDLYRKWPSAYELMPDDSYLKNMPIIFDDKKPMLGTDDTYGTNDRCLKNAWSLPQDMQDKVKKAMEFKKVLAKN